MGWPFLRRPPAAPSAPELPTRSPPLRLATDRWCAGDLAECIYAGPWYRQGLIPHDGGPVYSEVRMVRDVRLGKDPLGESRIELLIFDAYPGKAYVARCFRKIVPRADAAERADRRFVEDLHKTSAPAPEHA